MDRPTLLFYCQHSLGLGHLSRALTLVSALAEEMDVVLLNGGRLPRGTFVPPGVELVNLPPLGHDADSRLVSHDPRYTVAEAQLVREQMVLDTYARVRPSVLVVELYPFGRKAFEFELLPLLEAARSGADRPLVLCSLRDILVTGRDNQVRHDERSARRVNDLFDAVLVHSDPAFARLEDSFRPMTPLRVPVHYTGFVAPPWQPVAPRDHRHRLLVSSGGGMVGEPLVRAAVAVHHELAAATGLTTTVVAGPFLPRPVWDWLRTEADLSPALTAVRQVPDLAMEIAASALSLSQGGYNTTMDLLRAGTPAVVVPYDAGHEDEQVRRAGRLAEMAALRVLPAAGLSPARLLRELVGALTFRPQPPLLDLTGAASTTRLVLGLARAANGMDARQLSRVPA